MQGVAAAPGRLHGVTAPCAAHAERDALLKQADEEALAMIEAERAKHAAELADAEQQQADGDSASQVAIEQSKADQIRAVTAKADQHKCAPARPRLS